MMGNHYKEEKRGGIEESQHEVYNSVADAVDYWDYTLNELTFDILASVEAMYNDAGNNNKGYYIGFSQGTFTMFAALSKFETFLLQYIKKCIMLAPGTIGGPIMEPNLCEESMTGILFMRELLGVQSYFSSTWQEDLGTIC